MSYRHATDILDYMPSKVGFDPAALISAATALRAGDTAYGIQQASNVGASALGADAMRVSGQELGDAYAAQAADQAFGQVANSLLSGVGNLGVGYAKHHKMGIFEPRT